MLSGYKWDLLVLELAPKRFVYLIDTTRITVCV